MKVAVVATMLNEAHAIPELLDALAGQTRPPEEIILVDAGSTDGTSATVRAYAARLPTVRLLEAPGCNRAKGRNVGVTAAASPLLVLTDAGCVPAPDWVARMVAPLERDAALTLVSGIATPRGADHLETCIARCTLSFQLDVGGVALHPGGRALAFHRDLWEKVRGFPEAFDFCDDVAFILATAAAGARQHLEPAATVSWHARRRYRDVVRQFYHYAEDSAWAGLSGTLHLRTVARSAGGMACLVAGLVSRHWLPWTLLVGLAGAYLGRKARQGCFDVPSWRTSYRVPLVLLAIHAGTMAGILHGQWRRLASPPR